MTAGWEILTPLLVYIQTNLDGDLSLAALGRKAGLSPFHLQRLFKAAIGETPKVYTERLRIERAAFRLLVYDSTLLDLAIDCGFHNHETFTRAFRRRFGAAPSEYRDHLRRQPANWVEHGGGELESSVRGFEISATKVVELRPMHLAFKRHVGPYESVPDSLFAELETWAASRRFTEPPVWLGIGHDSPAQTPKDKLRFDAALRVPAPFAPAGDVAYQHLPGGPFAVTTHAGPYETLPAAYAAIFPRLLSLKDHQLIGLPAVEIYNTARVSAQRRLNHTDICLPVAKTRQVL